MTRTERAVSPRAIIRDRSESKSGLDKSLRKGGAGTHNWGSIEDERELEYAALDDERRDLEDAGQTAPVENVEEKVPTENHGPSDEEVQSAKEFRKNALKGDGVDLAAIARTSAAVSSSPPNNRTIPIASDANTNVKV